MGDVPNPDDPWVQLLPYVEGDTQRWLLVQAEVRRRTEVMGEDKAFASVRSDLEAGRL
jgi:hypothetical protein